MMSSTTLQWTTHTKASITKNDVNPKKLLGTNTLAYFANASATMGEKFRNVSARRTTANSCRRKLGPKHRRRQLQVRTQLLFLRSHQIVIESSVLTPEVVVLVMCDPSVNKL